MSACEDASCSSFQKTSSLCRSSPRSTRARKGHRRDVSKTDSEDQSMFSQVVSDPQYSRRDLGSADPTYRILLGELLGQRLLQRIEVGERILHHGAAGRVPQEQRLLGVLDDLGSLLLERPFRAGVFGFSATSESVYHSSSFLPFGDHEEPHELGDPPPSTRNVCAEQSSCSLIFSIRISGYEFQLTFGAALCVVAVQHCQISQ